MSCWCKIMNKSCFNENSNVIYSRLRELRKKCGMSQEELAAQMQLLGVDISQPLLSKIERNERFVKDYELVCLCRVLQVTEQDLLADFYEKYPSE